MALPGGATTVDLNGYGILDILAVNGKIEVLIGNGDGSFNACTASARDFGIEGQYATTVVYALSGSAGVAYCDLLQLPGF